MPTAIVCLTGSELTRGKTRDANGSFLAGALSELGARVIEIRLVPDEQDRLASTFREVAARADIVVTSGGLGPTSDDLTVAAAAAVFERAIVRDPEARERMRRFALERFSTEAEIPGNYFKQAEVLEGSEVFLNPAGLAPGFAVETTRGVFIVLPGVPRELAALYRQAVEPFLCERYRFERPLLLRAKVLGLPESVVEERVHGLPIDFERLEYGISARPGEITLELRAGPRARGRELDDARHLLASEFPHELIFLPPRPGTPLEEERAHSAYVHAMLLSSGRSLATAESCTGGLIAKRLTDHAGSSRYFLGSVVAYENRAKVELLGVSERDLEVHGAVSEEVAIAMARGARLRFGADFALAVTGVAGPGGGTDEKPVGLVWLAIASPDGAARAASHRFRGDRDAVRMQAATRALELLRRELENERPPKLRPSSTPPANR